MTTYSNENTGVAFTNEKRTGKQAMFKGNFCLNSEEKTHWVDVWGRANSEGKVYLDVRLTEMLPQGSDYADAEKIIVELLAVEGASEKAPAFKGEIELPNGDAMEMACWKRMTGAGKPLLSFKISEPFKAEGASAVNKDAEVDIFGLSTPAAEAEEDSIDEFDDSDVPF